MMRTHYAPRTRANEEVIAQIEKARFLRIKQAKERAKADHKRRQIRLHLIAAISLIVVFFAASWLTRSQTAGRAVETIISAVVYFVFFGEIGG